MKNWTRIFLPYVDLKIVSKAFAFKYETALPSITFLEETAYFEKRSIGEGGRLISDILSVTNNL